MQQKVTYGQAKQLKLVIVPNQKLKTVTTGSETDKINYDTKFKKRYKDINKFIEGGIKNVGPGGT